MPKVMRTGGVNVSEDVVRIRDLAPFSLARRPARASVRGDAVSPGEEAAPLLDGEGTDAADFTPHPLAQEEHSPAPGAFASAGQSGVKEEIIGAAMAEAGRILEEAVRKAEEARGAELAKAQVEAERLRREAAEAGRREGMAAVVQEVQQAARQLEEAIAHFEADRAGFETEYEGQLKWMALEIAEKVLAKRVAADDAEMLQMVEKAVQNVKNEAWVRVEVAQEMTALIGRLDAAFEGQENIEVNAVPAPPGTVQLETPSGVVDASLKTQLANLRDYFAAG